ncbi:MAG TPA: hypothetical protein VLB44_17350 [Kofleriaceae bacterium]|nr:hypothetical protein [Kofleriaceae bacterium]
MIMLELPRRVARRRTPYVLAIVCALGVSARADRPVHGGIGGGTSFLLTGAEGDRNRFELEVDIEPPRSRFGGLLAWRAFDDKHHGLLTGGLVYEAGAARPLLVVDLHADAGVDLDHEAPLAGGGIRTTLTVWKMIGIGLDGGAYLVIDGVDNTRLVLATSAALVVRW